MAKLLLKEKNTIEKLLDMGSGYVSDFSNNTFRLFIGEFFNIDIYESKYSTQGESKANRLRSLLEIESEYIVSTVLKGLLEHQIAVDNRLASLDWSIFGEEDNKPINKDQLYEQTRQIISRLKSETPVENIGSIKAVDGDSNFTLLAESIRRSIEANKPIEALDRLHTYMVRYSRKLCDKHLIDYEQAEPLHSVFGKYKNMLREKKLIHSEMANKILGNATQQLDKYNDVRNNGSLAHDNDLINQPEALLIVSSVANLIRFVDDIELKIKNEK